MRKLLLSVPILALLFLGCTASQQRLSYNTLATVGHTTDAAVKVYFDLVVAGKVSTNSIPVISKDYGIYQAAFNTALFAVQMNTNALAPQNVVQLSDIVISDINLAKGLTQ